METALQLASADWQVIATARPTSFAEMANATSFANSPWIQCLPLDVTDPDSIEAALETLREHTSRLDLLINNAGIFLDYD